MSFTHRMAGLVAVVAVPLGIAATSYALTDEPAAPRVPPAVHLSTRPTATAPTPGAPAPTVSAPTAPTAPTAPAAPPTPSTPPPTDSVVPGPSATGGDDDDDDHE
ncbi:small hydrophilic protein [Streptomyces sp. NPDC047974]|uniref:small hydrophilic protein n=1 Tax=Streptomyces sp. NPDC047974 TaxID=3154343 RepID=UPI0033DA89BC